MACLMTCCYTLETDDNEVHVVEVSHVSMTEEVTAEPMTTITLANAAEPEWTDSLLQTYIDVFLGLQPTTALPETTLEFLDIYAHANAKTYWTDVAQRHLYWDTDGSALATHPQVPGHIFLVVQNHAGTRAPGYQACQEQWRQVEGVTDTFQVLNLSYKPLSFDSGVASSETAVVGQADT